MGQQVGNVSSRPRLARPRSKRTLTRVVEWVLYGAGALAVVLGLFVWPGGVHAIGGAHATAGWLVVLSLWTLAAIGARAGVARNSVWLAAGWGLVTTFGALAQYQLRPGTWITVLHVATGVGAIAWGRHLLVRMRDAEHTSEGTKKRTSEGATAGMRIADAAAEFLAKKRIAVTGVSRAATDHGANIVYRRLRERGYQVFAINPNAAQVEGDVSFRDLSSIPGGVEAVVIGTRPEHAMETMRECAQLGVAHVWMHRSVDAGSVSEEAAAWGRGRGMRVIAGGCPLMFDPTADTGHKVMRPLLTLAGKVPRRV